MAQTINRILDFSGGANTTVGAVTSRAAWRSFDEALIDAGTSQRRLGKSRAYAFTPTSTIIDFDGTNDYVTHGTAAAYWPLGVQFTTEILFVVDSIASDRFVLGRSGAPAVYLTIKQTTTSTVVVVLTDSAGNTCTLTWTGIGAGTLCALLIARNGATVYGSLNNTVMTGTLASATNDMASQAPRFGQDNAGSWLDGAIDTYRILSTYETSQRHGWLRNPFPRADNVVMDYIFTIDADSYVYDRGIFEQHGTTSGSPATNRTALALNPDPVEALASNVDGSGRRQAYAVVGDRAYPFRVT